MAREMHAFNSFEEAAEHEKLLARSRTPTERIMLLHKLIAVWKKFPRTTQPEDDSVPVLRRKKPDAR